ncbi:hypothetical protein [Acinetobacter sp. PK01]|uniref:hypothetical protein n=1 Tax=Acinetobacter sp. PK01 TaxID=2930198 RepID=UPI001FB5D0F1|nr:hypothetical protein [Acinetobacter sp. PK01]UOG18301.1 hypothetical protein MP622_01310 [Acinetobacter sp. PK01]
MPRYLKSIVATTLLDKQNEKLSLENLNSLVSSLDKYNIPLTVEHDPRKPPVGRVIKGYVRERSDKEFEAVTLIEVFDGDWDSLEINDKEFPVRTAKDNLELSYSFSHNNKKDQDDIKFIDYFLNSKSRYEAKKSVDPISILSLTGAFILGGIASGFLNKIGSDAWDLIKPKIIGLVSKSKNKDIQDLLIFRIIIEKANVMVEVEIILTNPSEIDIEQFLMNTTVKLDNILGDLLNFDSEIRRIVFEQHGEQLQLNYMVRKNCVPLIFNKIID